MAWITILEAVKAGYTTKPTIYRYIEQGKLQTQLNHKKTKTVHVADLVQNFGDPATRVEPEAGAPKPVKAPPTAALEAEVIRLREEVDRARHEAALIRTEARKDRESFAAERKDFLNVVQNAQKQLADQTALKVAEGEKAAETKQPGFLKRLFS